MTVSIEDKKKEAVKRMRMWKIYPETVRQFEKDDLVSESAPPVGACFWLNEEQKARVKDFEEKFNALVYHVIHSFTNIGELENLLFVSDYPEEWDMDHDGIKNGEQISYVFNLSDPDCSEMGTIGVGPTPAAGLRRTW